MESTVMAKMKLYKFRSLATQEDFDRVKNILGTGKFWCSGFSSLNDPMEGLFSLDVKYGSLIPQIYKKKSEYKICSFSGEKAFNELLMWGYYANGFKGTAIEIEAQDKKENIHPVRYITREEFHIKGDLKTILSRKLIPWGHENEYRFLTTTQGNEHEIGEIKTVYFGDPFGHIENRTQIFQDNQNLQRYEDFRKQLIAIATQRGISSFSVNIDGMKVSKGKKLT